jgi:exodeoxyribonuclease III
VRSPSSRPETSRPRPHGKVGTLKIATFNINNVRKRLPNRLAWLASAKPDVVCLQELKTAHTDFPVTRIQDAGYHAVWKGEKTWNGVAILSRSAEPILTRDSLPGDPEDKQSRYIEAAIGGLLIGCLYVPNGNPHPGPKFKYKLAWLERPAKARGQTDQRPRAGDTCR